MTRFGLAGAVDSKITMYRTGVNKKNIIIKKKKNVFPI